MGSVRLRGGMFGAYGDVVERFLEERYGIGVVTRDIPDPLLGDLDGAEIHIDHAVTEEERLFLLAHLFGHTVQWNVREGALELGRPHKPPVPEELLSEILAYEREAAGYSLAMLHEAGIRSLDQWLTDYTATDLAYLSHYYRTGEKGSFWDFAVSGAELLEPIPVPAFRPERKAFRMDGIVI
jgi:hypothetical protein